MDLASTPPPFDPPASLVDSLTALYVTCSETTFYNVQAHFTGNHRDCDPASVVAVALQNIDKEERLLGLTAEMPTLERLHVWPLGEKPALFSISPSGLFFASVKESVTWRDMKGLLRDAADSCWLQSALCRTQVSTRLQIELFASGQEGGVGSLLCLSAPRDCKMPWGNENGGGAFCAGDENLFVFTAESSSRGQVNRQGPSETTTPHLYASGKSCAAHLDTYVFEPDWGEQREGCRLASLYCVDFKRRTVEMLDPPDKTYSYGQPRWLPDGSGVVCTAWSATPYCVGLQYCCNRRSKVFLALLSERWTSAAAREAVRDAPTLTDTRGKLYPASEDRTPADETQWLELSTEDDFAAWSPVVLESFPYNKNSNCTVQVAYLALEENSLCCVQLGNCLNTEQATVVCCPAVCREAAALLRSFHRATRAHMFAACVKVVVLGRSPEDPTKWNITNRRVVKSQFEGKGACRTPASSPCGASSFAGVYSSRLVAWRHPDYLFANTFAGNRETIVCLHPSAGVYPEQVRINNTAFTHLFPSTPLTPAGGYYSMKLLDTRNKWLLIEFSSLVHTPRLLVAELVDKEGEQEKECDWPSGGVRFNFTGGAILGGVIDDQTSLRWTPYYALVRHLRKLSISSDSEDRHLIVSWPRRVRETAKNTLAVFLHGGPHAVACSRFSPEVAYLTMMGYDVLFVNYRGSLGFGQEELLSLLGHIGEQDVLDVASAVKDYLNRYESSYDTSKTVVLGGSHGGFLTCHLLGQYPDLFAAAAARNPVTNLLSMLWSSDIPVYARAFLSDWVYSEALNSEFDPALLLEPNDLRRCYSASPVSHAEQITTPLLLGIGAKDNRVPPSQGIAFYKTLTALGRRTRLLLYPEADHRIHQPNYAKDFWINVGAWFAYYAGEPDKH